jgi:ATP-dependent RNA helicase DeaD
MLRGARIQAEWIDPPTAEAIRASDRQRLLEALLAPVEFDDDDREIAVQLLAQRSPEDVAAALVRAHRAGLPQAEELIANTPEAQQADRQSRHRQGFDDVVWFRLDVGRRQNADPRWILPLLCRRGHITRNEVGAIRIGPNESLFQVPRAIADKFAAALVRTAGTEDGGDVAIERSIDAPRDTGRPRGAHAKPHARSGPSRDRPRAGNDAHPRPGPGGGKKAWPKKPHRKGRAPAG